MNALRTGKMFCNSGLIVWAPLPTGHALIPSQIIHERTRIMLLRLDFIRIMHTLHPWADAPLADVTNTAITAQSLFSFSWVSCHLRLPSDTLQRVFQSMNITSMPITMGNKKIAACAPCLNNRVDTRPASMPHGLKCLVVDCSSVAFYVRYILAGRYAVTFSSAVTPPLHIRRPLRRFKRYFLRRYVYVSAYPDTHYTACSLGVSK